MTLNQHTAQKTRRFNEFHYGAARIEDALIEAQQAAIDADEDAALDELCAVAHLVRVGKVADLISVPDRFIVHEPNFGGATVSTYAAAARHAATSVRHGAPYITINYSEGGVHFTELWAKKAAS